MVLAQHCLEDGLTLMCFSQENFFAEHPPLTTVVKKTHYKNTGPSLVLDTVERNEATNNFWSSLLVITEDKRIPVVSTIPPELSALATQVATKADKFKKLLNSELPKSDRAHMKALGVDSTISQTKQHVAGGVGEV